MLNTLCRMGARLYIDVCLIRLRSGEPGDEAGASEDMSAKTEVPDYLGRRVRGRITESGTGFSEAGVVEAEPKPPRLGG